MRNERVVKEMVTVVISGPAFALGFRNSDILGGKHLLWSCVSFVAAVAC